MTPNDLDMFKVKTTNMHSIYTPRPKFSSVSPYDDLYALRSLEIIIRSNEIIICSNEIIIRGNEILFRGNEIAILTTFFSPIVPLGLP